MSQMSAEDEKAHACLVSHLDNPMFVVTVATETDRAGCLVGFATQCSIHPPRWYVGISKLNRTFDIAAAAEVVVVHALGATNAGLARLFGEQTGDGVDKFLYCDWQFGPDGRTPVLTDCPRWFAGMIVDRVDPGDHLGLILAPVAALCRDHGPQLGFQALRDLDPGHPA
ncbi:MAG TPA: flavin reductase [Acidimicrobiales bacterium]|jgi:flavin reductase (DIM6/NTAB) family NADH-FMN oxidoreductase RutF